MKLKCIAIDDEPLALEIIRKAIDKVAFLDLLQTFQSVSEALKFLSETSVDCIFLDIEMPDLNGLEFSKIINQFSTKPEIVFVTAYPQYIMKDYQIDSLGFLLKPFSFDEFDAVATKMKNAFPLLRNTIDNNEPFYLKVEGKHVKIYPQDIVYLESMGDYVKIYFENNPKPMIPLITLKKMKSNLPTSLFLQVNRSQIVNIRKIDSYSTNNLFIDNKNFLVSTLYRKDFDMVKKILPSIQ